MSHEASCRNLTYRTGRGFEYTRLDSLIEPLIPLNPTEDTDEFNFPVLKEALRVIHGFHFFQGASESFCRQKSRGQDKQNSGKNLPPPPWSVQIFAPAFVSRQKALQIFSPAFVSRQKALQILSPAFVNRRKGLQILSPAFVDRRKALQIFSPAFSGHCQN